MTTIERNKERHGVEIRFDTKPPEHVRERLKEAGWRFSRFGGCWWKRAVEGTYAEAHVLADLPLAEEEEA